MSLKILSFLKRHRTVKTIQCHTILSSAQAKTSEINKVELTLTPRTVPNILQKSQTAYFKEKITAG